jgi:hypothetical protein
VKTILAVMVSVALGGCTLFDDRPDHSCKTNSDCFTAQGETCNVTTKTCEADETPDGGTP